MLEQHVPSPTPAMGRAEATSLPQESWRRPARMFRAREASLWLGALASGLCFLGDLPLLEDPDGVAEGVADAHVRAVEVVRGLLGEVGDAARLEGLIQTPDVIRVEDEPAQRALRDQLAELRGGGFVMHRRARRAGRELAARARG